MATLTEHLAVPRATTARRHFRFDRAVLYVAAIALVLLLVWPFFWAVSSSLKDVSEITVRPPRWLPAVPQWSNYIEIWRQVPLGRFVFNSLLVTVLAMIGQIVSCTAVAYGFARFRFPMRDLLFGVALATLLLPREVTIIPQYLMYRQVGWLDTFLPLIVPFWLAGGGGAFTIFLMRQFFMTIPFEYDEAAQVDGASSWWILWRVILPLSMPALATALIFAFLAHWNDFWGPLIFLNSTDNFTLPLGLRWFQTSPADLGRPRDNLLLAAAVVATLPIVALYFGAQKYFVRGSVMTGIKG
jgi:ABC-type glycerol-3-phosphate transport system permease component